MSTVDNHGHTVEKIGGTSMSQYKVVRDNIFLNPTLTTPYQRLFVVSAYSGMTDRLLEHKRSGEPGVYGRYASGESNEAWQQALGQVREAMLTKNAELIHDTFRRAQANNMISQRIAGIESCLLDLRRLCSSGHFKLDDHLQTVRELLASLGEVHSALNTVLLLQSEGIRARLVDLSGWQDDRKLTLDERIQDGLADIDFSNELPIITGYAQCDGGLMHSFDRGYSEMTFSRVAVISKACEAIIHKEYHLSSADPRLVGDEKVVPIGRTNYDIADQLSNLGMEAIHPQAAKGLRQQGIDLRVKNTFEPEHNGTLITSDYVSQDACVEIIAGREQVFAIAVFDQDMVGRFGYDEQILAALKRFKAKVIAKDINANTITHFVAANLKTIRRVLKELHASFPSADISSQEVSIVSALGSDMQAPGILAKTVTALANAGISILAVHQSMRQVDMQFVIAPENYTRAICALHQCLVEPHNHGVAICAA
ncbi:MAG: aspartate kinase [Hahellaceae bacterium]|nr:aspartate kinase [Hahellaceae bacterium]MCP5168181.1 aspartate kinase [Hahellaceae bacterium]